MEPVSEKDQLAKNHIKNKIPSSIDGVLLVVVEEYSNIANILVEN